MRFPWQNKKQPALLSPLEGYDKWAHSYSHESNPIKDLSNEWVTKFLPSVLGKIIVDIGCGTGYFCQLVHEKGAKKITGYDLSPAMIEIAKQNCPEAIFECSDFVHSSKLPECDLIICGLVLGHIQDSRLVIQKFSAFLKPGGTLILSDFHPDLTRQNKKRTFKDITGEVFEIEHYLHPLAETTSILNQFGFKIDSIEEPLWNGYPVIYCLKATKV